MIGPLLAAALLSLDGVASDHHFAEKGATSGAPRGAPGGGGAALLRSRRGSAVHLWRVEEWKKAGGRKGGGMDTAIRSARGKGTDAQFFEGADAKRGEVRSRGFLCPSDPLPLCRVL